MSASLAQNDPDWVEDEEPQSKPEVEGKDGRTILKLGVKHSERLAPNPDGLQVGALFDEGFLDASAEELTWYRIPAWLAGQWRRMRETTVFSYDYTTGLSDYEAHSFMSEQIADFGVQKDRKGNVWNCELTKSGISDRGSYRSIAIVRLKEPVKVDEREVIFREVFTVVNVDKSTRRVIDSQIVESLTRHRPASDINLQTSMSVKVYNPNGTPRQIQQNIANERLISPMVPVNEYKGRHVGSEFAQFLRDKGLDSLIPR